MRNLQIVDDPEFKNKMWIIKDTDTGKTVGRLLTYEELAIKPEFIDDASIAFTINID